MTRAARKIRPRIRNRRRTSTSRKKKKSGINSTNPLREILRAWLQVYVPRGVATHIAAKKARGRDPLMDLSLI